MQDGNGRNSGHSSGHCNSGCRIVDMDMVDVGIMELGIVDLGIVDSGMVDTGTSCEQQSPGHGMLPSATDLLLARCGREGHCP